MLVERSEILVKDGLENDFAAAMSTRGLPLLAGVPGVRSVKLGRGVEHPDKFMLLVEWDSMEAHIAFTKTSGVTAFRELVMPFSKGGAMEHFEMG